MDLHTELGCYFLIILCFATMPSYSVEEAINSNLKRVQNLLESIEQDTKPALKALAKLQSDLKSNPDQERKISSILASIETGLKDFKIENPAQRISGCLKIASCIEYEYQGTGKFGTSIAANLMSSLLILFTGEKAISAINAIIDSVLEKYPEEMDFQKEAPKAKRDFKESTSLIKSTKMKAEITEMDITFLSSEIPIFKFGGILLLLENKILHLAPTLDSKKANEALDFILLYSQLVTMRDLIFKDLSLLIRESGKANHIADAVDNANKVNRNLAKDAIGFLHKLLPEQAIIGIMYHPIEHSNRSKSIFTFTRYFNIPDIPRIKFPASYNFQNCYWHDYIMCAKSYLGNYIFLGCAVPKEEPKNIKVNKLISGHYTIEIQERKMYITKHAEGWAWGTLVEDPGPQGHLIFVPLKSGDYLISTEKWPEYFIYMESSVSGFIRSWKGYPGPGGLWKIN